MENQGDREARLPGMQPPDTGYLGDKWIAASALQKAIRRGEVAIALDAAKALRSLDMDMLRRRVQTVLVEDVAPLDVGRLSAILTASLIPGQIDDAIDLLANAPKDRTPDYLLSVLQFSPRLSLARHELGNADEERLLGVVSDPQEDFAIRSLAAWYAGGTVQLPGSNLLRRYGNCAGLFNAYRNVGLPASLIDGCQKVVGALRNALPLIYPLIHQVLGKAPTTRIEDRPLPTPRMSNGIPLYALGGHTRLGKAAIRAWADNSDPLQRSLRTLANPGRWREAAELAVFHVESGAIKPAVTWTIGQEIAREAIEADFHALEAKIEAVPDFLEVAKEQLHQLDDIRTALIEQRVRVMTHGSAADA